MIFERCARAEMSCACQSESGTAPAPSGSASPCARICLRSLRAGKFIGFIVSPLLSHANVLPEPAQPGEDHAANEGGERCAATQNGPHLERVPTHVVDHGMRMCLWIKRLWDAAASRGCIKQPASRGACTSYGYMYTCTAYSVLSPVAYFPCDLPGVTWANPQQTHSCARAMGEHMMAV